MIVEAATSLPTARGVSVTYLMGRMYYYYTYEKWLRYRGTLGLQSVLHRSAKSIE